MWSGSNYTTPTINRLVTAVCVETQGGALGLNTLHYGPYFVVINGSEAKRFQYQIPEEMRESYSRLGLDGA